MFNKAGKVLAIVAVAKNFSLLLFIILPIFVVYLFEPDSFLIAWKGRTPYLFFLWLLVLEFALAWSKISQKGFGTHRLVMTIGVIVAAAIPTAYIIAAFLFGLNPQLVELGKVVGVPFGGRYGDWFLQYSWPLSLEYLFLTTFFAVFLLLAYRRDGLKWFSVSLFFLGATGLFYLVDTFYPYGTLVALQSFVPVTASVAACFLGWVGYSAEFATFSVRRVIDSLIITEQVPLFTVSTGGSRFSIIIYWPCAGVQGLFIYTFAIVLFLRGFSASLRRKVVYFAVGLVGTFLVNVLRIAAISVVGVNSGSAAAQFFHSYFGELFFISWLLAYFMIILFSRQILATISNVYSLARRRFRRRDAHQSD